MYADYVYNGKDVVTKLISITDAINITLSLSRVTEPKVPDLDINKIQITVLIQILI